MIKVVICDGDGTIGLPRPDDQMRQLLTALPRMGIRLAVASNKTKSFVLSRFAKAGLAQPSLIATPQDFSPRSVKKPSPEYVTAIQAQAGVSLNELAYIGDDDATDIFCAINARVLPIAAQYSNQSLSYGIPVSHPKAFFQDYLSTFGGQSAYFGWRYQGDCTDTGATVDIRSLICEHRALGLTENLRIVLKDQGDVAIGSNHVSLRSLLFHYSVSQLYLSGLVSEIDCVTVYPGHLRGTQNQTLAGFSDTLARTFRKRYWGDLLVRHTDAIPSHVQSQINRKIYDQFRTISVNPEYRDKMQGKTILVVDDYTTYGHSLETARRMLLRAGAARVIGLSIAKYRFKHAVTHIQKEWDPFLPCTLAESDIVRELISGEHNVAADDYLQNRIWPVYSK